MGTVAKVKVKSGVRWKGLIRRGHKRKAKTFRLKSNAKEWVDAMERGHELAIALGSPGATITFEELAAEYLENYEGRDHTRAQRVGFWVEQLGKTRLTDIKPSTIKRHLQDYQNGHALTYGGIGSDLKTTTRKLAKKRSPATRNRAKAALAAVMSYAREKEYLSGRIATSDVPTLKEDNKRTRFLSYDERDRLIQACRESDYDRLYLLVIMALTTGCRLGELTHLKWKDVDFEREEIYLRRTKNGDPRLIPLAQPTIIELKKFRGIGDALVFPGKRLVTRPFTGFRTHWAKAKEVAGIQDFRFNDIRHSVGAFLAMMGYSLLEIGDILGHRSEQTTKRYAHLSSNHKRKIIAGAFDKIAANVDSELPQ